MKSFFLRGKGTPVKEKKKKKLQNLQRSQKLASATAAPEIYTFFLSVGEDKIKKDGRKHFERKLDLRFSPSLCLARCLPLPTRRVCFLLRVKQRVF